MLSFREQRVIEEVELAAEEVVRDLQQMIRFPTITPAIGSSVRDRAFVDHQEWVARFLEVEGIESQTWEVDALSLEDAPGRGVIADRDMSGMPVVTGRLPGAGGGRSLILNGHYDVVPAGDAGRWRFPPFSGTLSQQKVYGRGAADMKGGLAAMLHALRAVRKAGFRLAGDVIVQIVPDEEATCMGTLSCCLAGQRADAAIIPEPTGMQILVAMRGSVYGSIHVQGRSGHAELVQPAWQEGGAVNAISRAARIIAALDALAERWASTPDRIHPLIGPDFVLATQIQGGEWEVTYPDAVEIGFGAMFAPGREPPVDEIRRAIESLAVEDPWLAAHPPRIETGPWYYGAEVNTDEPVVRLAADALSALGVQAQPCGFGSLTDAIHLINMAGIPTISVGPDQASVHGVDEHIEVRELMDLTRWIALMLLRWCGMEGEDEE